NQKGREFLCFFDSNNSLQWVANTAHRNVEQRGLAAARAAADQDVCPGLNGGVQQIGGLRRERVPLDELVPVTKPLGELPDRDHRSAQRERWEHRVES